MFNNLMQINVLKKINIGHDILISCILFQWEVGVVIHLAVSVLQGWAATLHPFMDEPPQAFTTSIWQKSEAVG